MPKPIEGSYVNVLFEPSMLKRIDDYRWKERIASRTEAIRVLIERGLKGK